MKIVFIILLEIILVILLIVLHLVPQPASIWAWVSNYIQMIPVAYLAANTIEHLNKKALR